LEIDDYVHLWVAISSGILHLVSHDGLSTWRAVEMTVDCPGASRASVTREPKSNVVYLFYEQTETRRCRSFRFFWMGFLDVPDVFSFLGFS
jgi:hypothetical protein